MNYAFRLKKGADLKKEIIKYARENNITAGVIVSSVGCLDHLHIRLAGAKDFINKDGAYEIVSITGTIGIGCAHIHISVSDEEGNTYGGHLKDGCIVNTTAEIVLLKLDNYIFTREFDPDTGYDELVIREQ